MMIDDTVSACHSDCCRLILEDILHSVTARNSCIEDTVVELEHSYPDTIARMLLVSHTVFPVNSDGVAISKRSGMVRPIVALHRPYRTNGN